MHLLFDFDGTLVDSYHCVLAKTRLLACEHYFRNLSDDDIEALRDLSSGEIIKFLKIPLYKIPKLIREMRKHLHNEMQHLTPFPTMYSVVERLYNNNCSLGILTSNSVDNVAKWLDINDMSRFFDFIHTESNYFSKKYLLKKTLSSYKIDKSQAYYIGDETRDIEAAKKNKVKSIAVTWGYNSEKALLKSQPSFIAKVPNDLVTLCEN